MAHTVQKQSNATWCEYILAKVSQLRKCYVLLISVGEERNPQGELSELLLHCTHILFMSFVDSTGSSCCTTSFPRIIWLEFNKYNHKILESDATARSSAWVYIGHSHSCAMKLSLTSRAHFCMEREGSCQLSILQLLSHQNIISYGLRTVWPWDN